MEETFINAMEIRELFNENTNEIRFKIKELQNAAQVANAILELSELEEMILKVIIYSSKIQVMDFLYEYFNHIRLILSRLPSDEDLKLEAKSFMEDYKLLKEKEMKNELGEDTESSDDDTDSSDDENNKTQDESNENASDDDNEIKDSEKSENDADDKSEGTTEVDEDSENQTDEESVEVDENSGNEDDKNSEKSTNSSEADNKKDIDDGMSDTSTANMIETVYN